VNARDPQTANPVVRIAPVLRYVGYLQAAGAPVGRLLQRAGIPAVLLDHPGAVVSLQNAFRFAELACRSLGTEHLGLQVGLARTLEDLGPYGQMLQRSLTVHEYLRKGVSLYNMLMTGQRLWLSRHGREFRLNIATVGATGVAAYQSQMETLVVTISELREAAGPNWTPEEISLAYRSREDFPNIDLFAGSQLFRGTGKTYLNIPRGLMASRFSSGGRELSTANMDPPAGRRLPEDLGGLVRLQIESLLSDRAYLIDSVAETLNMSRRSLQRKLAAQGLTYSHLLTEARMTQAGRWLETSDMPIAEIAFALGYTDASNFTRAFRWQTGVSPQAFREKAGRT
jgi:AraC-like DNA-binding protein